MRMGKEEEPNKKQKKGRKCKPIGKKRKKSKGRKEGAGEKEKRKEDKSRMICTEVIPLDTIADKLLHLKASKSLLNKLD